MAPENGDSFNLCNMAFLSLRLWTVPKLLPDSAQIITRQCPNYYQIVPQLLPDSAQIITRQCPNYYQTVPQLLPDSAQIITR